MAIGIVIIKRTGKIAELMIAIPIKVFLQVSGLGGSEAGEEVALLL